jgi:hypothetical protein
LTHTLYLLLLSNRNNKPEVKSFPFYQIHLYLSLIRLTILLTDIRVTWQQSLNHFIPKITPLMGIFNPIRLQMSNNIFNFVKQLHYKPYKSMT